MVLNNSLLIKTPEFREAGFRSLVTKPRTRTWVTILNSETFFFRLDEVIYPSQLFVLLVINTVHGTMRIAIVTVLFILILRLVLVLRVVCWDLAVLRYRKPLIPP